MEEKFKEIFEKSPIGIIFMDKEGKITDANQSTLEIMGYPSLNDVIGLNIFNDPYIAPKKDELLEKGHIKIQSPVDFDNIKKTNIYNPTISGTAYLDLTISVIDSGFLAQIQDITEQKKAELEIQKLLTSIQEEKDKLSSLINSIPDEVWFADAEKNLELVNPSVALGFGNDLKGKEVEEIAGKSEVYRPDGTPRPVEEAPPLKALKGEIVRNQGEIVRIPTTGELRHRQVNSMPVKDARGNIIGSVSVVRDITENKKAEEALKEREELYRTVFENSQDGFQLDKVLFDESGEPYDWLFLDVNDAFEHQTGLKKNDVIGKRAKEVIPAIEARWINTLGRVAKTGKSEHTEDYNQDTGRWYDDYIFKYRENQVGILFRDITPRKHAEQQLKEAINELERSNTELQQFAYVSSHDLQEPLRTIASFTQLLERRYKGKFDSDADEFMDFIVEAAIRMKEQIEGLLEYSRVATKGKEFKLVDMNLILNQTIKALDTSIKESKAKITFDELPTVNGDADQLQRVFQNLISNAIKFRKCEEPPIIHIASNKDIYNKEYVFSIKDNGIGIEEQYSERIFVIFQRLHTRNVYKGTGIGLSIVKRIIERHDGRIWVESEYGVSSTFYFTLPIE